MQLCESFDLLIEATEHERKYPSQADDSSTSTRRVQFILTRVLNKLNNLIEISDTQAVAGLMRFDAGQCSEIFWVYDSRSMENFMIDEKYPRAEEEAVSERSEEESLCDSDSLHDFVESNEEDMPAKKDSLDTEMGEDNGDERSISASVYNMDETEWLKKTNAAEMLACEASNDTTMMDQWSDLDSVDEGEGGEELDDSNDERNDSMPTRIGPPEEDYPDHVDCPFEIYQGESPYGGECSVVTRNNVAKLFSPAILVLTTTACPVYKVTKDDGEIKYVEALPYAKMYRFRGKELSGMSRYEYFSAVKLVKAPKSSNEGGKKGSRGRKKNSTYELENPDIDIRFDYVQVLRSKQCTLKLVSNPPPFPGLKPADNEGAKIQKAWRKKANRFSLFYLLLFRPETKLYSSAQTVKDTYDYEWPQFLDFVRYLKRSKKEIDKERYETMMKFVHGWKTRSRDRIILRMHRNRSRTRWTDDEKKQHSAICGRMKTKQQKEYQDLDLMSSLLDGAIDRPQLGLAEQRRVWAQVCHGNRIQHMMAEFSNSLPAANNPEGENSSKTDPVSTCPYPVTTNKCFPDMAAAIRSAKPTREESRRRADICSKFKV